MRILQDGSLSVCPRSDHDKFRQCPSYTGLFSPKWGADDILCIPAREQKQGYMESSASHRFLIPSYIENRLLCIGSPYAYACPGSSSQSNPSQDKSSLIAEI